MGNLYHGSIVAGINELKACSILHDSNTPCLYLTNSIPYALVYIWDAKKNHYNHKYVSCGIKNGIPFYEEQFPDQLKTFYKGVRGYLYCVSEDETCKVSGRECMYASFKSKPVMKVIEIEDVYEALLAYESKGEFQVLRYLKADEKRQNELDEMMAYFFVKNHILDNMNEQTMFYKRYFTKAYELAELNREDKTFLEKVEHNVFGE